MKVKIDENLPQRLASKLADLAHDVHTVVSEGLKESSDKDVWQAARREQRFLITQDLDFSDVRQFKPGTHPGSFLVRLREPSANALMKRISAVIDAESLESFAGCFVVLTDRKLRIKRP